MQNIVINIINMLSKENHRNIQTNEEKVKPLKNQKYSETTQKNQQQIVLSFKNDTGSSSHHNKTKKRRNKRQIERPKRHVMYFKTMIIMYKNE